MTISLETDDIFPIEITNWGLPLYYTIYPTPDGNFLADGPEITTMIDGKTLKVSEKSIRMNLYQLEPDFSVYRSYIFTGKRGFSYYLLMPSGKRFIASEPDLLFLDAEGAHGYRINAGKDDKGNNLYKFCVYGYKGNLKWKYQPKIPKLLGDNNLYNYFKFIACGKVVFLDETNMVALDSKTGEVVISTKIARSLSYFSKLGMVKNDRYAVIDTNIIDFKQKKVFSYQEKLKDFCANVFDEGFEICINDKNKFIYKRFDSEGRLTEELKYAEPANNDYVEMDMYCVSNYYLCYLNQSKDRFFIYNFKKGKEIFDFELDTHYFSQRCFAKITGNTAYVWADNYLSSLDLETDTITRSVELLHAGHSTRINLKENHVVIEKKKLDENLKTIRLNGLTNNSKAEFMFENRKDFLTVPYQEGFLVSNKKIDENSHVKFYKGDKEECNFSKIGINGKLRWLGVVDDQVFALTDRRIDQESTYELWVLKKHIAEKINSWIQKDCYSIIMSNNKQFAVNITRDMVMFVDLQDTDNIKESRLSLSKNGLKEDGLMSIYDICGNNLLLRTYGGFYLCNAETGIMKKTKGFLYLGVTKYKEMVFSDYGHLYYYINGDLRKSIVFDSEYEYDYPKITSDGYIADHSTINDKNGKRIQQFLIWNLFNTSSFSTPTELWPVISCCDNEVENKITFEGVAQSRKAKYYELTVSNCKVPTFYYPFEEGAKAKIWGFALPDRDEFAFFIDDKESESLKEKFHTMFVSGRSDCLILTIGDIFLLPEDKVVDGKYKTKFVGKQIADADTDGNIVSGFIVER
jgi:regulator of replication initiation timing